MVSNFELEEARGNVAIMITAANTIDFVKFTLQKGRYFMCKYGKFQVDSRRKYRCGKTNYFLYDTRMGNGLDVNACKTINEWLAVMKKTEIMIGDLNNQGTSGFLGTHAVRFLQSFGMTDEPTIIADMLKAFRGEKPVKAAGSLGAPFIWPAMLKMNFGLFFIDNKFVKLEKVTIVKEQDRIYADHKHYGRFDVTSKEVRYTYGKANIFFAAVSTTTMPEEQKKRWRKIANTFGEMIDADRQIDAESKKLLVEIKDGKPTPAVNMTAYNYMADFSPYEPIEIDEKIKHAHHQKRMFDLATKAPQKKMINIVTVMIVIIVIVIGYQQFVNPQVSQIQTNQERQANIDRQNQQQNNPQPPSGNGTEVIGGQNPIPAKMVAILKMR